MAKNVIIDGKELLAWAASTGETQENLCEMIGRSRSFLGTSARNNKMGLGTYKFLLKTFDIPDGSFLPKVKEEPKVTCNIGYHMDLQVFDTKLKLGLWFDEEEIVSCYSKIRGGSEFDLVQAISYAAHMLYKFAEQRDLSASDIREE